MKSVFLSLFAAVLTSLSEAQARSRTMDAVEALSYKQIITYNDGTTAITFPQLYGYFFRSDSRIEAQDNAEAICRMLKLTRPIDSSSAALEQRNLKTVLLKVQDGQLSEPRFVFGGNYGTVVISKVLCR